MTVPHEPGRVVEDCEEEVAAVECVVAELRSACLGVAEAAEGGVVEVLQDVGADEVVEGQPREEGRVALLGTLAAEAARRADVGPRTPLGACHLHE